MTFWTNAMMIAGRGKGLHIVGVSTASAVSGNLVLDVPDGVQDGDLLTLVCFVGSTQTNDFTAAGFAIISDQQGVSPGAPGVNVLIKIASGEGATITVATGASGARRVFLVATRGGDQEVDVVGLKGRGNVATIAAPSITPTSPGILLAAFVQNGTITVVTPPAAMELLSYNVDFETGALYALDPSPAGATGTKTIVWSGSGATAGLLIQIS